MPYNINYTLIITYYEQLGMFFYYIFMVLTFGKMDER